MLGDNGQVDLVASVVVSVSSDLATGGGIDNMSGDEGDDALLGGFAADTLLGDTGRDVLLGVTSSSRNLG